MTDEAKRDWVLAKCKELSESKDYSLPFHIERGTDPHSREYFEQGYSFVSGDGDLLFELAVDFLPSTTLNLAAILLGLPEEGKQQLELIWETKEEDGGDTWIGHQLFFTAAAHRVGSKWAWRLRVRGYPNAISPKRDYDTRDEAIWAAKTEAAAIVAKHLVLPSPAMGMVKAKPIEWVREGAKWYADGDKAIRVYESKVNGFSAEYRGVGVAFRVETLELAMEAANAERERRVESALNVLKVCADFTPAPSPQPLVDALKEIVSKYGDGRDLFESAPEMAGIASSALKDWEGKQ